MFKHFFGSSKEYNTNNDEINLINDFLYKKIFELYTFAQKSLLIENYFFESFQLKLGELFGYYDLDRIKLDCGDKTDNYVFPRVIKCKIKYYKIITNELNNRMIVNETINIDRKIILVLIQTFTRCVFNNKITNGKYIGKSNENFYELNKENQGKFISLNRNRMALEFYTGIPNDTNNLINKFYELTYDKQNLFLVASEAYLEGLKENSGKALTSFVIALESLANNKYKNSKMGKSKRIYELINKLFEDEIVTYEFIQYIYDIRCLYSHEAISNNQIKGTIFGINEVDHNLILKVEALTYTTLIKWLIEEE